MKKILILLITLLVFPLSAANAKVNVIAPRAHATAGPDATVFMTINNNNSKPVKLVSAHSNMAARVELHKNSEADDESNPQKMTFLTIPQRGSVALAPENTHLMLHNISRPLKVGESIPLTLTFSDGEVVNVVALIVDPNT